MFSRYLQLLKSGQGVGSVLARGSLRTLMVRIASAILALILQVTLARALGVTEYGIFAIALAWLTVLAMVSRLGMDTGLTRLVAEYRAKQAWGSLRGVLRWAMTNTLIISIVVAGIAAWVTWMLREFMPEGQPEALWIAFAILPLLSLTALRQGALRGFKRVVHADLPEMVLRPIVMLLAIVGVMLVGSRITAPGAMGISLFAYALAFLVGSWWLWQALRAEPGDAPPVLNASAWWKISLPLVFMQGMQIILGRLDILMLGTMEGPDAAGIYTATSSIAQLVVFGLTVVNPIAAPLFSELFHTERKRELQRVVTLAARFTTAVTVVAVLFLLLAGEHVLGLFGDRFVGGYIALMILLGGQVVNALSGSVGYLMMMTGHQNATAVILLAAAGLNILLNVLLIPRYGIEGVAAATAVTVAAMNIAMVVYVRVKIGVRSTVT